MQQAREAAGSIPSYHPDTVLGSTAARQHFCKAVPPSHGQITRSAAATEAKRDTVCGTRVPRANGRRALCQSHQHNGASPSSAQGLEPAFQDTARRPARGFSFSKTHSSKQHRIEMTPLLLTLSVPGRNPGKKAITQLNSPHEKSAAETELLY